ncbi:MULTISPECIES: monovalent cation/H+ antiporter subunit D family protein [Halolamina]|uniref:Multicomponent Na+:H+ antiporter subunit D n=1 Tax=Halolamina pelagica TaxID=699431 RepID=A0A1I5SY17_9EURY|nr:MULTISPECIES: monovalent cation/H+ antiporter subunit D family protein [Halolamina]NHX36912.1 monovalent cation/H+ antiporter subunit D family protein [Halolamina sp. R1-12]SFP75640.1 multicomponent Na+:H+ antiporter subunit D [Halolamina pelagica]
MSSLPALLVAAPLLGSVLALLAGLVRSETGWPVALVTAAVQVAGAGVLASRAFDGTVSYVVGGFTAPFGIELVVDGLSATIALLVAVVSLAVLAYSRVAGPRTNAFYAVYLLLVAGLTGMSITGDVFNMYVFLEITGLAAYALVASGEGGRSARAALKYLIVGTVGASLFLLGIGYAFVATGTLNMADLSTQLAAVGYTEPLVQAAFALLVVGLFVKVAVFPLHAWQPDAYAGSPDSVSALISALVSTVAAYALIRIVFTVFTVDFLQANPVARSLLVAGAIVSIVFGSVLAVSQTEIKRMLAYSSVSQFGLVVGAVAVANETALIGATVHLVGHAVMKGGLFLTAGLIATATGAQTVDDYEGLIQRLPLGAGAFGLLALAMVGVPPAVGFVGKWYIALGAVEAAAWPLAVVILLSTLLTLAYFARILERMFFRDASGERVAVDGVSPGMTGVVVAAALAAVVLGMLAFEYGQLLEPTVQALLS